MFGRKRESSCHCIKEMFSPYIDGKLKTAARLEVETHIAGCQDCRHELQSIEATVQLLRRMPVAIAPRSFTLAQAPNRQPVSFGTRISGWVDATAAALIPSATKLKLATAIAVVALMVMVTGDLTGALHTDGNTDTVKLNFAAFDDEPISTTPSTSSAEDEAVEATPATPPTETTVAENLADNGPTEVGPPPTSVSPLSPENPFEASELASETSVDSEKAFSWLRPAEIALAALAFILGCITLLRNRRTKRFPAH